MSSWGFPGLIAVELYHFQKTQSLTKGVSIYRSFLKYPMIMITVKHKDPSIP